MQGLTKFKLLDYFLMLVVALGWGNSFILMYFCLQYGILPFAIVTLRLLIGSVALFPFVDIKGTKMTFYENIYLFIISGLMTTIPFSLLVIAQTQADTSIIGLIMGATQIFSTLFSLLLYKDKPSIRIILGIILGFSGVAMVSISGFDKLSATLLGITFAILATICYGLAFNLIKNLQNKYGVLAILSRMLIFATIFSLPLGIKDIIYSQYNLLGILFIIILGLLSTGFAYIACFKLVTRQGLNRSMIAFYLAPIVSVLSGTLILGEKLYLLSFIGLFCIIIALYLNRKT